MSSTGVWDVLRNKPLYVFFGRDNDNGRRCFMSEYSPEKGFGIYKTSKGYNIYTNTYVYEAKEFCTKSDGIIGILIGKHYPMKQSQTLEAAVKRVQVIGLPYDYFCKIGERTPKITSNGVLDLFEFVDSESKVVRRNLQNDNENQMEYLAEHEEIILQKQKFEEDHLFSIQYLSFADSLQNTHDGVVYKFDISSTDEEAYLDKITENTGVEITANDQGRAVLGTIIEAVDGWLYIKFHDVANSYDRIAKSGYIKERMNPEYAYKLDALKSLKTDVSPNKYLLSILAERKTEPFTIRKKYCPHEVREKDGSVHLNVNPSQKDAIEKALNVEDFLLVQGPPGTGKTTIITEMIQDFVRQGLRILICSKNNLAVDNVLEKCQDLFYDEEKTKKMQCLRLGNEEKVLPSVRESLARSLTLKIQNDIKVQSEEARIRYLKKENSVLGLYNQSINDTRVLCELIKYFLSKKEQYTSLMNHFQNSKWIFLLGKGHKEKFLKALIYLSQQIENLSRQLLTLMRVDRIQIHPQVLKQYTQLAMNTFDTMELLMKEIETASLRYSFVLGKEKTSVLAEIEKAQIDKRRICNYISILFGYKGNPAANELDLSVPEGGVTVDYVDLFQKEIETQITRLRDRQYLLRNVLNEWHKELESDQASLEEPLLRTVRIIGATCIGVNTKSNFKNVEYDVAIVDEAGQITLHDLLVPLVKAKKIILIGDHLQLPPSSESDFCEYIQENNLLGFENLDDGAEIRKYAEELDKVFSMSLFEELFRDPRFNNNKVMLDTQFRMHPVIAEFISANFYDGKYKSGVTEAARTLKISGFSRPMYFVDTCSSDEKYEDDNPDPTVHVNSYEARICAFYLSKIIVAIDNNRYELNGKSLKNESGEYDIGVITAYKKQIGYIRKELSKRLLEIYGEERVEFIVSHLAINTLDSFQGRDNQIIFYSFVRSNREYNIGFLNEVRRLNVMMTRAKSLLVMIGDSETLTNSKRLTVHDRKKASDYYTALVDYCKKNHGYIDYMNEV